MKKENRLEYKRAIKHLEYEKFISTYNKNTESSDKIIKNVKELEKNNQINDDVVIVYSRQKRKIEYLTKNVFDLIGYSAEEITEWKSASFFKFAKWSHIDFLQKVRRWGQSFSKAKILNTGYLGKNTKFLCGLKIETKNKGDITLFIKSFNPGTNDENSDAIVCYISDISHFFKGDFYWGQYECEGKKTIQFRHSNMEEKTTQQIISGREKQVLLATMDGKSKSEVGILLNISPETVSKHKKNMLARTGAKDTTSLVHILKICGVI